MKNKTKIIVLSILCLLGQLTFFSTVYASDTYPYPSDTSYPNCTEADPWGFCKRYCTSYAAHKVNESGVEFSNTMSGPNGTGNSTNKFGDAGNWDNHANSIGFIADTTPALNSVFVLDPNQNGAGSVGHVAWVENVNSDSTVNISEYNWGSADGAYNTRNNKTANHYIHFNECEGANVTIQNKTVTNGSTYSCGVTNSITVLPNTTFSSGSSVRLFIN